MVSLSIFTVVAIIAVGAFLKIIDANKQSQALQTAMNNTSFALDSMVREMRVGTNFTCFDASTGSYPSTPSGVSSCTVAFPGYTKNGIAFYSSQTAAKSGGGTCNLIHEYRFYNDVNTGFGTSTLEKAEQTTCNDTIGSGVAAFIPLVSADLNIQSFNIGVSGDGTLTQPKIFMTLQAFAGPTQSERTYFTVQTSASERSMNGS